MLNTLAYSVSIGELRDNELHDLESFDL